MGHREDLLAGAVRCLRDKGYANTTARDIVAASGTNLASIGYHYGSTEALLNAAVLRAIDEFGAEIGQAVAAAPAAPDATMRERFERFWEHIIASFRDDPGIWLATFDIFTVALRNPQVRAALADGMEDGRLLWGRALYGIQDPGTARAAGSLHQALLSGILIQWLADPQRAPSATDLGHALAAISSQIAAEHPNPAA
jgi:AcrR family transcriptional regulator